MGGIGFGLFVVLLIAGLLVFGAYYLFGMVGTLLAGFLLVCFLMIIVVLIQRPKGGGLSGAFGGAGGSSQAVFGAKVGDVLTWVTVGCFVAFLGLAMGLTYAIRADVNAMRSAALIPPTSQQQASDPIQAVSEQRMDVEEVTEVDIREDEASDTSAP